MFGSLSDSFLWRMINYIVLSARKQLNKFIDPEMKPKDRDFIIFSSEELYY